MVTPALAASPADERPPDRPDGSEPGTGTRIPVLELRPGDRVRLPVADDDGTVREWSEPVTIISVLLIDTGLAQVRWEPGPGQSSWAAHRLLTGPAFHAGAVPVEPPGGHGTAGDQPGGVTPA